MAFVEVINCLNLYRKEKATMYEASVFNHCGSRELINITYSEWVFVSSMQCSFAILSSVACPTLQYFFILSKKRHGFRKRVIEHKMCTVSFLQLLSESFLILRRTERDIMKTVYWYLCKVSFILEAWGSVVVKALRY